MNQLLYASHVNVGCPPLKIAGLISLAAQRLRRAPAQTQSIPGFSRHSPYLGAAPQRATCSLACTGLPGIRHVQWASRLYRSPEARNGARCSVATSAKKRQMQGLGALASRGVAVLMCIPAETIRPHLNLTCNLQVAGNEKRTIRGAQGGLFLLLFLLLL